MHRKLLGLSLLVTVAAGTIGTLSVEAGIWGHATAVLPFLLAGVCGIVASAMKMRA